ncbi:uncharacterized protein LOC116341767 [Contarinia nasturtii]|uniref:uncharacterized protein LOC116341767 n=1 Tax=Contarinia nasturtii TaxID=265458 RepID=UPI0012D39345|nr:uncharacterized protein LOC116341767 [Contarinia nasturtii]
METYSLAKKLHLFVVIIFMQFWCCNAWNLRPKDMKLDNLKICEVHDDNPVVVDVFDITQPGRQKYTLNSTIRVLSDITNNIYFQMNISRCTVGRNKCDDLETLATPNVCKSINMPNTLWSPVIKSVKPPLSCPLKMNTYHVDDSVFDLSLLSRIPVDPCKMSINLSFYDYPHESERKKRHLLCISLDLRITQARSGERVRPTKN